MTYFWPGRKRRRRRNRFQNFKQLPASVRREPKTAPRRRGLPSPPGRDARGAVGDRLPRGRPTSRCHDAAASAFLWKQAGQKPRLWNFFNFPFIFPAPPPLKNSKKIWEAAPEPTPGLPRARLSWVCLGRRQRDSSSSSSSSSSPCDGGDCLHRLRGRILHPALGAGGRRVRRSWRGGRWY